VLLGRYLSIKKDYKRALDYLIKSFESEIKTVELARDILKLYEETSRDKDELYDDVQFFIASENLNPDHWLKSVNSKRDLDVFILYHSISSSMDRLNIFIGGRCGHQVVKFRWSLLGLREYIKQAIFRVIERVLLKTDSRYVILTQLSKDIDNKIEAVIERVEI
jgi:hypothetical protein